MGRGNDPAIYEMADQAPTQVPPAPVAQVATDGTIATPAADAAASPAPNAAPVEGAQPVADGAAAPDAAAKPAEPAEEKQADLDPLAERQGALAAKLARTQAEARKLGITVKEYEALKSLAKSDPRGALDRLGISFDDLVMAVAGEHKPEPTVDDEVAELKRWKQEREQAETKAREDAEKQRQQQVISDYIAQTAAELEKSADKFPIIVATGQAEQVFRGMVDYVNKYGEIDQKMIPTLRNRVAAEVEKALAEAEEERLTTLFEKAPTLVSRVSARFNKPTSGQQTAAAPQAQTAAPVTITSSNQTATAPPPNSGQRTEEEVQAIVQRILRGEVPASQFGL